MGAIPSGPSAHFHTSISESFFVLSGTVRLYDGERWADGSPGDFLYVPPGGIHAFRNESGEPASMLLLFTPGAPREDYFETLARQGLQGMTEQQQADFFLRHVTPQRSIEFVPLQDVAEVTDAGCGERLDRSR